MQTSRVPCGTRPGVSLRAATPAKATCSLAAARPLAARASPLLGAPIKAAGLGGMGLQAPRPVAGSRTNLKVSAVARPAGGASRAPAPTPPAAEGFKWGAKMKELLTAVAIATAIWFIPAPAGVTAQAWHLLAIFIGTIVGIITTPLPLGAVAMLGLGASMVTQTLTFAQAFSAFANEIP